MPVTIRRRELIAAISGAAAWPFAARAQAERIRRIGVLMGSPMGDSEAQADIDEFWDELHMLGWTNRNTQIDIRWTIPGDPESMQRFAKELVALQPDVILSHTTPTTAALLQETHTIPIVFAFVSDPVGSGFVAGFSRPGGNVTGLDISGPIQAGNWVRLLKEIAPDVRRVAIVFNPASAISAEFWLRLLRAAVATDSNLQAILTPVRDGSELDRVLAAQAGEPNSAIIAMRDRFLIAHREKIILLASRYRLPVVYPYRLFVQGGGLLSYGVDQTENFRRAATYVDRILKGASPSELPVQSPVKFQLVVNFRTAKSLGLTIPMTLLQHADEILE
jgi:putative tryptophan/tyrosine transport system substrate-binding protein